MIPRLLVLLGCPPAATTQPRRQPDDPRDCQRRTPGSRFTGTAPGPRWRARAAAFATALGLTAAGAPPDRVFTYDARPLRQIDVQDRAQTVRAWDTLHLLSALQGLANRDAPRLYLFYAAEFGVDTDAFWLEWLRQEDGWLAAARFEALTNLDQALRTFQSQFAGLVVYDPAVPATANLASTAAGVERLLPVRFDPAAGSLYRHLTGDLHLPVRLWLVNPDGTSRFNGRDPLPDGAGPASGSAKIDACRWAIHRFLASGACAPGVAAYALDAFWLDRAAQGGADLHTLSNHDYFIARRAFFFDLSPWGDEAPVDDPRQPIGLERRALLELLRALHDRAGGAMIKVGGFVPWPYKYTTHAGAGRHEPVATEWEYARLISQFNAYLEADAAGPAAMANASFFQHYPLKARYPQPNPRPTRDTWRQRGWLNDSGHVAPRLFVAHYVGDYDAPSWLYKAVPAFFRDPARGAVPLGWAFNPNLADRAPVALAYAYRHATTNDFFITGDSGAGYLNVRALTVRPDSGLPSGLAAWSAHCRPYYSRWDMSITGFVLDGAAGAATESDFAAYAGFSPDGLGTHFERGPAIRGGIPSCPERDLPDTVEAAAAVILERAAVEPSKPGFLWARSILRPPRWYAELSRRVAESDPTRRVVVVDPYSFFGLIRCHAAAPEP